MKNKELMLKLTVFLIVLPLMAIGYSADALSCEKIYPKIASVDELELLSDGSFNLRLKQVYSFSDNIANDLSVIGIDNYAQLAKEYANDNFELFIELDEEEFDQNFKLIKLKEGFANKINFENSDIIISGPPTHICSYVFLGIFDKGGNLKQALIRGDFTDYSFAEELIMARQGRDISCGGYSCIVKTDFTIADKKFTLVPGQELELQDSLISKIFLLNSSAPEAGVDAERLFPWGQGRIVEYLLEFNPSKISLAQENRTENPKEAFEDPASQNGQGKELEDTPQEKLSSSQREDAKESSHKNAISRFFIWLKELFRN